MMSQDGGERAPWQGLGCACLKGLSILLDKRINSLILCVI